MRVLSRALAVFRRYLLSGAALLFAFSLEADGDVTAEMFERLTVLLRLLRPALQAVGDSSDTTAGFNESDMTATAAAEDGTAKDLFCRCRREYFSLFLLRAAAVMIGIFVVVAADVVVIIIIELLSLLFASLGLSFMLLPLLLTLLFRY